jgi:conjugal transfer ATP-binding protein TraC
MKLFGGKQAPAPAPAAPTPPGQPVVPAQPSGPPVGEGIKKLEKGMASLVDLIAPSSVEVDFRYIRVGERYFSTHFMVGYPRYVSASWLSPVIDFDHTLDISMFMYPTANSDVLGDLKRKIAEMEATIASEEEQGKVVDPKVPAALEDALALQEELAKGVERFFQFSFYITISADSVNELTETHRQLQTTLASLLLTAKSATLQMEAGFKSSLPIGQDRLYLPRNMDTTSLASTFPFTSAILTQNKGVMYGINQQNGSLIIFDRFSMENANEIVLGKSGAGKSYLIKLEIMRQFMLGTEVIVIDPEGEYATMAGTVGGEVVSFTSNSPVKINPFDLSQLYEEGENELGMKILSLHALLKIIMGQLNAEEDAMLDKALVETYRGKGITPDPASQKKEPPLMEDLYKTLLGMEDRAAKELAYRLEKFIKGSAAGIFNQPSNFDLSNPLTIFDIKQLEEELRPIAMHIILDYVWTRVKKTLKKRLLILDEAWYMMKFEDSAQFVFSIAKRARKYYLGMTTATQDVEDFLKNDYGKAVLTNSSIQMLLKQGTAEVDLVGETFFLSEGERELLLSAGIGEGLFFAGQNHVAMKVLAAPFEHELITSNPAELMKKQNDAAAANAAAVTPIRETPVPTPPPPAPIMPIPPPPPIPQPQITTPPVTQPVAPSPIATSPVPPPPPVQPAPQAPIPQQPVAPVPPVPPAAQPPQPPTPTQVP